MHESLAGSARELRLNSVGREIPQRNLPGAPLTGHSVGWGTAGGQTPSITLTADTGLSKSTEFQVHFRKAVPGTKA